MAVKGISSVQQKKSQGFMTALSYAFCEWFLIFLLFLDAALSYLLTKFAQYCHLQAPCPLCSRIDHVFEKTKPGYYRNLICSDHREEISSLVNCHCHNKLADVHAMCEDCITSFVKSRKSSSESYRLLADKIGVDIEESGLKILLLSKSFMHDSSCQRTCSCCNRILRAKSKAERLLQVTPIGFGASKANVKPPLPRVPGRSRFSRRNSLKRLRDKISGPISPRSAVTTGGDKLSHVGYSELKITSDSESEFPMSDDGYSTSASYGKHDHKTECYKEKSQKLPEGLANESGPKKQIHQSSEQLPSLLDLAVLPESSEHNRDNSLAPSASLQHGLGELKWDYPLAKPNTSQLPELISLDDVPQESAVPSVKDQSNLSIMPGLAPLNHALSSFRGKEISDICHSHLKFMLSAAAGPTGSINATNVSLAKNIETTILDNENHSQSDHTNSPDKLTSGSEDTRGLVVLAEPLSTTKLAKIEDLKSLPQLLPSERGSSSGETLPVIHVDHDEIRRSRSGSSDAIDTIQMAAALARHDSDHDTLDGISVKEIEGESLIERLKRQVDHDQRCIKALFKELEEERNAASIAANEAMAMITRLQEEKASLHMEALQYLRMMEEQAEYDMEALEKANDLLAEREKELQDLEAELEIYRNNYLDVPMVDGSPRETSIIGDNRAIQKSQAGGVENGPSSSDASNLANSTTFNHKANPSSSSASNFECEKVYISQCLQMLEKKLHQLSSNQEPVSLQKDEHSEKITIDPYYQKNSASDNETQIKHVKGDVSMSLPEEKSPSNPSHVLNSADLVLENHLKEKNHLDCEKHSLSSQAIDVKIDSFQHAITNLKDRLEALEIDRDILKLALNSLQNGNEGLQFIQEISHQLQQLRNDENKRSLSVH